MRKQTKPYVTRKATGGKVRWYYRMTWLEGGKRRERFIALPDDPDSPEFDRAYWSIRSGKHQSLTKPVKQTWRELASLYRASPRFRKLSVRTRQSYDSVIDWILEHNAGKSVSSLNRQRLRELHLKHKETPRKADMLVQVISILTNFARTQLDWQIDNPAEGLELFGKQREYEPWPQWMVDALSEAPEIVRSAAELILGTGQRPTAAVAMRRDAFNGEWMSVTDEKGDETYEIFCPHQLREYLATLKPQGAHVLARNLTEPMDYNYIGKQFRKWRDTLGARAKPYSLHGLRKLSIIRLAEAGWSDAQIQAVTNQSPQTVAYYRKRASRKILSKSAHRVHGTERD